VAFAVFPLQTQYVIVLPECALEILMERLKGPYCAKSMLNNFAGHCKLRLIGVGLFDQR
jgi:hypothetical protein